MNTAIRQVVIHQSGKVGSSTLFASLKSACPEWKIEKAHFLSPYYISYFDSIVSHPNCPPDLRHVLRQQQSLSNRARGLLDEAPAEACCIIGGVRDPLSYAVSAFFQNVKFFLPDLNLDPAEHDKELARLNDCFFRLFEHCGGDCPSEPVPLFARWVLAGAAVGWYTDDYCPTYGMDLPDWPRTGADTIRFRHADRLHIIYRFEAFPLQLNKILLDVGLPTVDSQNQNMSANKPYARLYDAFKRRFQPTPAMWDFYYESPFFRHFYNGASPAFPAPHRRVSTGGMSIRHGTVRWPEPPQVKGWRARPATPPADDELELARRECQRAQQRHREVALQLEQTQEQLRQTEQRLERTQLRLKQTRHTLDVAEGHLPLKKLLGQTETRIGRAEQQMDGAERRRQQSEQELHAVEKRLIEQCQRNTRAEQAILSLQTLTEQLQSSKMFRFLTRLYPRLATWAEAVRGACDGPWEAQLPAAELQDEVDAQRTDRSTADPQAIIPFPKQGGKEEPPQRAAA